MGKKELQRRTRFGLAILVVLALTVLVFIWKDVRTLEEIKSFTQQEQQTRYFQGMRSVPGNKTSTGNLTISCPEGTEINISSCAYEVFDPYNQCTTLPAQDLACEMENAGTLACLNLEHTLQNSVCRPDGSGGCYRRDATPYVASFCNGRQKCHIPLDERINQSVGPDPCDAINVLGTLSDHALTEYSNLPQSDFHVN